MSIKTIYAGGRKYRVTPGTVNVAGYPLLEIGPGGTQSTVSCVIVQFVPEMDFNGTFAVLGRVFGTAADEINTPFVPIPYRVISLNNVAGGPTFSGAIGYPWSQELITGPAIIQIPTNGLSTLLEVSAPTLGACSVAMWDLQGSSAV